MKITSVTTGIAKISETFNLFAGWIIVAAMALMVVNIIFRIFGHPIDGVYEWVGFMIALVSSFSLAYCGLHNGHISIDLLVKKLSWKAGMVIDIISNLLVLAFLLLIFYQLLLYANSYWESGQVSPTTLTPIYPFIYGVALGILVFSMVLVAELLQSLRKGVGQ